MRSSLRVALESAERARRWRFHPQRVMEKGGDELVVRFRSGGLREIADHVFTWGGQLRIEGPEELRVVIQERLVAAREAVEFMTDSTQDRLPSCIARQPEAG